MKHLLLLLLAAFTLLAADATGVWKATVDSPDGSKAEIVFDLKVVNGNVTGTIYSTLGEMNIIEGKVDGNKISFTAEFADTHVIHQGTFTDKEMKLDGSMAEQKFSFVLKKN